MELSLLRVTEQEVVMPYLVRAEIEKPGCGTFKTEAETKRDAVEKAQRLRTEGFRAYVTDATGAPVDETADD
jgi:Fe-S cluster assembly iron-binding protein IscA